MSFLAHNHDGVVYHTSSLLEAPGLLHGFSTRLGGVSRGVFAFMNLRGGGPAPDDRENVRENYRRLCAALGALAGGYIGAEIAKLLSEGLLKGLMLVALPVVALFLVLKKDFGQDAGERRYGRRREMLVSLAIGLVIGCYDGMIGPGTGTFMIMAFTALLHMDMVTASGCSKVGNLASNIAAAVSFIIGGKVMWALVVPAAACSMLGNYCGARYAIRGGGKKIRGMIFVVLGMLFVKMLADLFL